MLTIGGRLITLEDYQQVLHENEKVAVHKDATERIKRSYDFLETFHQNKIIYGINTGLGPMAQYRIEDADRLKLHYNAIRSHAAGCGEPVEPIYVRSAMITLLSNFSQGYSGIHPEVIELLIELVNLEIIPVVPEHGSVGASGDLVQLAHIALTLIGEGEVFYKGKKINTTEAFSQHGLKPISIHVREGLSLINGTSFMTGTGVVNLLHAKNLIYWAVTVSAMINEIVRSFDDYFSAELNQVKKHYGQNRVAELERYILRDSKLIRKREEHFFNGKHGDDYVIADKVQEYYSIRCVPQVLGPILDTVEYVEKVLLNEANSSNDNPMIDAGHQNIFHGGNFHGDYISLEMDKLKITMTKLSILLERPVEQ
jgi:histidine ammonia-lyase